MYAREKKAAFSNCAYSFHYLPAYQEIHDSSWSNDIYWELKMKPLNRFLYIYLIIWDAKNSGV